MKVLKLAMVLALLGAAGSVSVPALAHHKRPAPVDRSRIPVLKEETTIFGDATAWTRVRLPESIGWQEIDLTPKFKGDGRAVGVFLIEEEGGEIDPKGEKLWMADFGHCATPGCAGPPGWGSTLGWELDAHDMVPAGVYRLYLVVDGAPASVSFEIPRLEGATRINPTRTGVRAKVQTLTPQLQLPAAGLAFAAGDEAPFSGRGISLQELWIDPLGAGAVKSGLCWYRRAVPEDSGTAYLPPGCDLAGSPTWWMQRYTPLSDECCLGISASLPFIPKAMGSWYISTTPVESSGATALWLKLD